MAPFHFPCPLRSQGARVHCPSLTRAPVPSHLFRTRTVCSEYGIPLSLLALLSRPCTPISPSTVALRFGQPRQEPLHKTAEHGPRSPPMAHRPSGLFLVFVLPSQPTSGYQAISPHASTLDTSSQLLQHPSKRVANRRRRSCRDRTRPSSSERPFLSNCIRE